MADTTSAPGMSKMEAVRKAIEKLGKEALPVRLQGYVKDTFGIDMTADHVSNYKGKILRGNGKKPAAPQAAAPKPAAPPAPASEPAAPKPADTGTALPPAPAAAAPKPNGRASPERVTKLVAVGQAIKTLGKDASRGDLQAFVKEHFGFAMSLDHVSNCKSEFLKQKGAKKAAVKKPAALPAAPKPPAPKSVPPARASAPGIGLGDIEVVKGLVGRVGIEQLKGLIDLFAK